MSHRGWNNRGYPEAPRYHNSSYDNRNNNAYNQYSSNGSRNYYTPDKYHFYNPYQQQRFEQVSRSDWYGRSSGPTNYRNTMDSRFCTNKQTSNSNPVPIKVEISRVNDPIKPGITKPVEKSIEIPKETPKEYPKEISKEYLKEQVKESPKETPKECPKEKPKETQKEYPKEKPKETSKEYPKEKSKEYPKETSKEYPKETSKKYPKEKTKETSKEYSKEKSKEYPKEKSKEYSKDKSKETSKEYPKEKPKETLKEYSKENSINNSKDRSKEKYKENSKEKCGEHSKERPKEKSKENHKETQKDYSKDIPKEKPVEMTQKVPDLNSTEVLSVEKAFKLSQVNQYQQKRQETDSEKQNSLEIPTKRRRIDSSGKYSDDKSSAVNVHLKVLEDYGKELEKIRVQLKSEYQSYREIREQLTLKTNLIKELELKKKTIKEKLKKTCRNIDGDNSDDDSSDKLKTDIVQQKEIIEIDCGEKEIIDVESSDSDSDESENSNSSSVQFVSDNSIDNSTPVKPKLDKPEPVSIEKLPVVKSQSIGKSSSKGSLNKEDNNNKLLVDSNQFRPSTSEKSYKLIIDKDLLNPELPHLLKADIENGIFNAVEPKIDIINVSDDPKTYIMDVKVFNNRLFMCATHGILRQYNLITHECIMKYNGHLQLIHCLLPTVHPVGVKRLLSGGFDRKLLIHHIDTAEILHSIESEHPILSICDIFDYVFFGTGSGSITSFSLEKNKTMCTFPASKFGISCLAATKESNNYFLFVGSIDGEYSMWNALTCIKLNVITPVSHVEIPIGFIILQKQRILAYTKNHVHFIHYIKSKNSTSMNHLAQINSVSLTKNYLISGGVNGQISVYKIKGSYIPKNPITIINNTKSPIISLTFYNNTIISGDKSGKIYFNRLIES